LDLAREEFNVASTGNGNQVRHSSRYRVRTQKVPGVLTITPIGESNDVLIFG
jgi:hypothetical protein